MQLVSSLRTILQLMILSSVLQRPMMMCFAGEVLNVCISYKLGCKVNVASLPPHYVTLRQPPVPALR